MKKHLLLLLSLFATLVATAAPWDINNYAQKQNKWVKPANAFDDPYVVMYTAYEKFVNPETGKWTLRLYVELGDNAPYPYRVTLRVYGDWTGGVGVNYKYFDVTFYTGQTWKFQDYLVHAYDEIYPATVEWWDQGPI